MKKKKNSYKPEGKLTFCNMRNKKKRFKIMFIPNSSHSMDYSLFELVTLDK